MSSFKNSKNIQKKESGQDYGLKISAYHIIDSVVLAIYGIIFRK